MTLLGMGQFGSGRAPATMARLVAGRTTSGRRDLRTALRFGNAAWLTVLASLALSILGIYAIDVGDRPEIHAGAAMDLSAVAWKQVVFLIVGLLGALIIALPHNRFLSVFAWPAMVVSVGLLVFLMLPIVPDAIVRARNGARSWIALGPVDFQPSEVAKIAFVAAVARYMRFRDEHRKFTGLIVPGLIAIVPIALITKQPDLGTASLFVPSLFVMLVAAGARLRHLFIIVACAGLAAPAVYPVLAPHQKNRIDSLIRQMQGDRSQEQGIAFQPLVAQDLAGAGGLTGLPEGKARSLIHYNALPARHNDMIFAIIVHRLGLLGGLAVFAIYLLWIVSALCVAGGTREPFARLLVVGLTGFIAAQFFVNVGMTIGLLPIIGITLPFVSYGGSSLLTAWLMTGLVVNVAIHRDRPSQRRSFEYAQADDITPQDILWKPQRPARPARA